MPKRTEMPIRCRTTAPLWLFAGLLLLCAVAEARAKTAADILKETAVKGGLIVHIGCGDGRLTAALRANERDLVYGVDADPPKVAKA